MTATSILDSVKKVLGMDASYTVFDLDVTLHINTVFSILNELGIGPEAGFMIEDNTAVWDTFLLGDSRLNQVKSYVFLRVKLLFDPPTTSFHIDAMKEQIRELEWRINVKRENESWIDPTPPPRLPPFREHWRTTV